MRLNCTESKASCCSAAAVDHITCTSTRLFFIYLFFASFSFFFSCSSSLGFVQLVFLSKVSAECNLSIAIVTAVLSNCPPCALRQYLLIESEGYLHKKEMICIFGRYSLTASGELQNTFLLRNTVMISRNTSREAITQNKVFNIHTGRELQFKTDLICVTIFIINYLSILTGIFFSGQILNLRNKFWSSFIFASTSSVVRHLVSDT